MIWWQILLIVIGSLAAAALLLLGLLFLMYMFNLDSKLLAVVQKLLNKVYDKRERNRHLE